MNHKVKLSALFVNEGGCWVGQCLEHDIAAQGSTFERATIALRHTVAAQIFLDVQHKKEPLSGIKEAPAFYREQFEKGVKLDLKIEISDAEDPAEINDVRMAVA